MVFLFVIVVLVSSLSATILALRWAARLRAQIADQGVQDIADALRQPPSSHQC